MEKAEALKSLAFYQSLSNEFRVCPPDCVPLAREIVRLHLRPNEFIVYSVLIDKLRFTLPSIVTSVPTLSTSISDLADSSNLLEDEVSAALKNLESQYELIELKQNKTMIEICLYDISQVVARRGA